jgi:hypothetical protein
VISLVLNTILRNCKTQKPHHIENFLFFIFLISVKLMLFLLSKLVFFLSPFSFSRYACDFYLGEWLNRPLTEQSGARLNKMGRLDFGIVQPTVMTNGVMNASITVLDFVTNLEVYTFMLFLGNSY